MSATLLGSDEQGKRKLWDRLDECLDPQIDDPDEVDALVSAFLRIVSESEDQSRAEMTDICTKFLSSGFFKQSAERIRYELIILTRAQGTRNEELYIIYNLLLLDGRDNALTYRRLLDARLFPELIKITGIDLLYEICRVQQIRIGDYDAIKSEFIEFLFNCTEMDVFERTLYCDQVVRLILILNEQFMVATLDPRQVDSVFPLGGSGILSATPNAIQNLVIDFLSRKGLAYRQFGTLVIFLFNRACEQNLQLMILKFFWAVFSNPQTFEYLYANDLRVLVDIFIRELYDLPDEEENLRHTFLRVLHPMLANTQLKYATYYKRDEIVKLLTTLSGASFGNGLFKPVSRTQTRLIRRCLKIPWITGTDVGERTLATNYQTYLGTSLAEGVTSDVNVAALAKSPTGLQTRKKHDNTFSHA